MPRDSSHPRLKRTFAPHSIAVMGVLSASVLMVTMGAQAPSTTSASEDNVRPTSKRDFPVPTNLKALPKSTSGKQVHEIMEVWQASLNVRCDACHAEEPNQDEASAIPRLNFADDSKPMKEVARTMYRMTEEINQSYLAKIDSSGMPVTCGTCHRGHVGPEPFVIPLNDESPTQPGSPPSRVN